MHVSTEKTKAAQKATDARTKIPVGLCFGHSWEDNSIHPLQNRVGNQAGQQLLPKDSNEREERTPFFWCDLSLIPLYAETNTENYPKPTNYVPLNVYEQEADRVADRVVQMPVPQRRQAGVVGTARTGSSREQGKQRQLPAKKINPDDGAATSELPIVRKVTRSPGVTLDLSARKFMEPRFDHDFSQVRIHTDAQADEAARTVKARAFTLGNDIVFAAGQYAPHSTKGSRILAHELTHVVQQTGCRVAETGEDAERINERVTNVPNITYQTNHCIQAIPRDCDQEQIECFRRCWNAEPPWPIERGRRGHYLYCQSKCLAEYMACIGEQAAEKAFSTMADAMEWLANHPEVVVGTIVVVAGITFIVVIGGAGGLVLVPAAASDRRLKHSIKPIGVSPKGLKIYNFKYRDKKYGEGTWQGVMSDEIPDDAVIKEDDGFDRVDYSKIDVDFVRLD